MDEERTAQERPGTTDGFHGFPRVAAAPPRAHAPPAGASLLSLAGQASHKRPPAASRQPPAPPPSIAPRSASHSHTAAGHPTTEWSPSRSASPVSPHRAGRGPAPDRRPPPLSLLLTLRTALPSQSSLPRLSSSGTSSRPSPALLLSTHALADHAGRPTRLPVSQTQCVPSWCESARPPALTSALPAD